MKQHNNNKIEILNQLLTNNIEQNILKLNKNSKTSKIGLLFSGGIDSVLISLILKKLNVNFDAYCGYVDLNKQKPKDLIFARKIAKELNINLIESKTTLEELKKEKLIPKLIDIIDNVNPIHIGVSIPIYLAIKKAKQNNCKFLFTGSGSDELFAGYSKFKDLKNNKEIIELTNKLLDKLPRIDLKRDSNIAKIFNTKLINPYLDQNIIDFALNLKKKNKINTENNKIIIRKLAEKLELKEEYYSRKKVAAQYGSNSNKVLKIISKENNFKNIKDYLISLKPKKLKLACLYSGGKDSNLSLYLMEKKGYTINCLLSLFPETDFSYMYQKTDEIVINLQAKALNLPILTIKTKGEKEKELKELELLLIEAKESYNIDGIITGALFSEYQKVRIEDICNKLYLKCISPLWQMSQEKEMELLLKNKFKFIFIKIAAYGLDKSWLGKIITKKDLEKLKIINKKVGINIAGEGGEFESLVIDSPDFKKKLKIIKSNIQEIDQYTSILNIEKIELTKK
jgi:asparagine synthase (glutamine-hydrolysing)